jgi:phosphoglycolate phosphatase-like HAD superfamily hydrolase
MIPAAIFFDFDGVILDSVAIKTEAMRRLFVDEEPATIDSIVELHRRHGGISRFRKFEMIYSDILCRPLKPDICAELGARFEMLTYEALLACPEIPGAHAVLERHFRREPLFIVSGTPEDELKCIATAREMAHYFVSMHGSPRTKGEILADLLKLHALDPRRCVCVGDSTTDSEAARTCRVSFIGVVAPGLANPFGHAVPTIPDLTLFDAALVRLEPSAAVKGSA